MKNLGFLIPEITNCGPVNVVINLIEYIDSNSFNIMLISTRESKTTEELRLINKLKIKCNLGILFLQNGNHAQKIQHLNKISNELDIIHSHGFFPDKYLSNINNIHKISTIHNMLFKDYMQEYGYLKGFIGAVLHRFYLKKGKFNHIVGCSFSVFKYNQKVLKTKNLTYIKNGVDQKIFCPITIQEKIKRKKDLQIENKIIFIFAGRLIRRKRVPEMIEKFQRLPKENTHLLILGDGPEYSLCQEKINQCHNISLLGQKNNPTYYYQLSDFVISDSSAEGYPMSIIEAVSCGCYAFLSNIPPHNEFIQTHPDTADFIDNLITFSAQRNLIESKSLSAQEMADKYTALYCS